jgi:hypothetical protein
MDGGRDIASGHYPNNRNSMCPTDKWKKGILAIMTFHDNSGISRREKLVRGVLVDRPQERQDIWGKLDDSMLAIDALIETIDLLKANFLRFEGNPGPKEMSRRLRYEEKGGGGSVEAAQGDAGETREYFRSGAQAHPLVRQTDQLPNYQPHCPCTHEQTSTTA